MAASARPPGDAPGGYRELAATYAARHKRDMPRMSSDSPTIPPPNPGLPGLKDCQTCGGAKVVPSGDRRGTVTCPACNGTGVA